MLQQAGVREHQWMEWRGPGLGKLTPAPWKGLCSWEVCKVATGRAGKEFPVRSRSQPTTEIPFSALPKWQ